MTIRGRRRVPLGTGGVRFTVGLPGRVVRLVGEHRLVPHRAGVPGYHGRVSHRASVRGSGRAGNRGRPDERGLLLGACLGQGCSIS